MRANRTIAIVTVLLLVASAAVVPGAVSATSHLSIDAEQDAHGEATVTVNSSAGLVEGAVVQVTPADANDTYVGSGEYETGPNGTATLPAPESDVSVVVNATDGNGSVSSTVLLLAPTLDVGVAQADDASATVTVTYGITGEAADGATVNVSTVDENATYAGSGSYSTGADGTATLPAPSETVDVSVEAETGDLTGSTTATLQNQSAVLEDSSKNFGDMVSSFVHLLTGSDDDVPWIGRMVASFVTEHNPGKAPDHAGPKDDDHGPSIERANDHGPNNSSRHDQADGNGLSDDHGKDTEHGNDRKHDDDEQEESDDGGPPEHASGNGRGHDE